MPAKIQNDRLLKALRCEPVDRVPVWLMRQAGRYLPEYRAVRQKAGSFLDLCQNPQLACEVTLQPVERFGLDAAILFSDILTVPHAMGLPLRFAAGEGPIFDEVIRSTADVAKLQLPDPEQELHYVVDAVREIKRALRQSIPLIGFAGSPWTVAAYMVEGHGSKTFSHLRAMAYRAPEILHALLAKVTQVTISYLKAQVAAGADVVQVFDTWGGLLSPHRYAEFSLAYMQQIVEALQPLSVPVILFTKGGGLWLEQIKATGCHGIGLDWTIDPAVARAIVGPKTCLQGNLDPAVLYGSEDVIAEEVARVLNGLGRQGTIFNLGHGMYPDIDPEAVTQLLEAIGVANKYG